MIGTFSRWQGFGAHLPRGGDGIYQATITQKVINLLEREFQAPSLCSVIHVHALLNFFRISFNMVGIGFIGALLLGVSPVLQL